MCRHGTKQQSRSYSLKPQAASPLPVSREFIMSGEASRPANPGMPGPALDPDARKQHLLAASAVLPAAATTKCRSSQPSHKLQQSSAGKRRTILEPLNQSSISGEFDLDEFDLDGKRVPLPRLACWSELLPRLNLTNHSPRLVSNA